MLQMFFLFLKKKVSHALQKLLLFVTKYIKNSNRNSINIATLNNAGLFEPKFE